MANDSTRGATGELRAWYLQSLLPKLVRAAGTGAVDLPAVEALDADVRALLDISQEQKDAA